MSSDLQDKRSQRQFTDIHASLLHELAAAESDVWSDRALLACLQKLRTSTITEAWSVAVQDAWTDGPDAFCVVYRSPHAGPSAVGVRRARADAWAAATSTGYTLGQFLDVGMYELGDPAHPDPEAFGETVAEFDIGEPIGATLDILQFDAAGTGWWGSIGAETPCRR